MVMRNTGGSVGRSNGHGKEKDDNRGAVVPSGRSRLTEPRPPGSGFHYGLLNSALKKAGLKR